LAKDVVLRGYGGRNGTTAATDMDVVNTDPSYLHLLNLASGHRDSVERDSKPTRRTN